MTWIETIKKAVEKDRLTITQIQIQKNSHEDQEWTTYYIYFNNSTHFKFRLYSKESQQRLENFLWLIRIELERKK